MLKEMLTSAGEYFHNVCFMLQLREAVLIPHSLKMQYKSF